MTSQIETESQIIELATESFKAFCDDVAGMFGVGMQCEQQEVRTETIAGLKKCFKKLVAVNVVDATGVLKGTFRLIFDQEGLFTLGGVIIMLPEQRILANRKDSSPQLAASMIDAIGEAGNLLVGSWDRTFREGIKKHGHFLQRLPAFVGKPWDEPQSKIGLSADEELIYIPYEMTIGSYPPFNCGVIFPKSLFAGHSEAPNKSDSEPAADTSGGPGPEDTAPEAQTPQDIQINPEKAGSEKPLLSDKSDTPKGRGSEESMQKSPVAEETPAGQDTAPAQDRPEPPAGKVSEAIRKMSQSSAILPGEPDRPIISKTASDHPPRVPGEEKSGIRQATRRQRRNAGLSRFLSICAKDIMQGRVIWASPEETVQQVLAKMQQHDTGYIMVGVDGALEGIVSRSDITGALSPYLRSLFAKWRRPLDDATLKIKIKWIMSRPVRTLKPQTPLVTIMENVCRFGGSGLPVVDEQGKVQGLVTVFNIFQTMLNTCADVSTAGRAPQTPPLT